MCVLLAMGFVSCASTRPEPRVTPLTIMVYTVSDAIDRYNSQCLLYDRIHCQATIDYQSGETKKSFNGAIYMDTVAHKVRLRADAYFISIFDMNFEGDHYSVYVPSQKTCYRGQGDSFRGFALQDLNEALSPRLLPKSDGNVLIEEDQRDIVLTEVASAAAGGWRPVQRVFLARPDLVLVRRSLYYESGVLKSDLYYRKPKLFKIGTFASEVRVTRPWQGISVTLNLERFDSPPIFNANLFTIDIPSGTKTVDLQPNMSEDILFRTSNGSDH